MDTLINDSPLVDSVVSDAPIERDGVKEVVDTVVDAPAIGLDMPVESTVTVEEVIQAYSQTE